MASKVKNSSPKIAVCAFDLRNTDGAIQILPAGKFDAPYGSLKGNGPWFIDKAVASRVINRVAARANDMLIDYEHQSLLSQGNGQPAPAAGWAPREQFEWREGDGLYLVNPKWTDKAAAHIAADEYRYQSPIFSYSPNTGEVLDILNLTITNSPAIDDMDPLALKAAAKQLTQTHEEDSMNETLRLALLVALGLSDDADLNDDETASKAATAIKKLGEDHAALTASAEKHDEAIAAATQKADERVAAAKAGEPDPAKFVPVAVVETLKTQVAALTTKVNDSEMEDLIQIGMSDGKILPAQEDWARSLDVAALKGYLDNAAGVAALSGHQTKDRKLDKEGNEELNEQELSVCKATGIEPEDYKKTKAAIAA